MKQETIAALDDINRRFYSSLAADFSATRQGSWPGWIRLVPFLRPAAPRAPSRRTCSILDVGCGNGRLRCFLAENLGHRFRYTGVDSSRELIEEARRTAPAETWIEGDLGQPSTFAGLEVRTFDSIAALAVLHHVPSRARRQALIESLTRLLLPGGTLLLSHWLFADDSQLRQRILPWERYNERAASPIDVDDLEDGDFLLPWGSDAGREHAVRYCHHTTPGEAEELVGGGNLVPVSAFRADGRTGRLNLYQVLRRRAA